MKWKNCTHSRVSLMCSLLIRHSVPSNTILTYTWYLLHTCTKSTENCIFTFTVNILYFLQVVFCKCSFCSMVECCYWIIHTIVIIYQRFNQLVLKEGSPLPARVRRVSKTLKFQSQVLQSMKSIILSWNTISVAILFTEEHFDFLFTDYSHSSHLPLTVIVMLVFCLLPRNLFDYYT